MDANKELTLGQLDAIRRIDRAYEDAIASVRNANPDSFDIVHGEIDLWFVKRMPDGAQSTKEFIQI